MNLSTLYESSNHYGRPSCSIYIDHKKWYPNDNIHMKYLQITLSTSFDANMACMEFVDIKDHKVMNILSLGTLLTIELGYQENEELVFMGYLHRLQDIRSKDTSYISLYIEAMDVKGMMMLHKQSVFSNNKKSSALVKELLYDPFYSSYITSVKMDTLPSCMDHAILQDSQSDYDILCHIAQAAGFFFFIQKDVLLFQKADTIRNTFTMDTWNGIDQLEIALSLDNAFGQVEVISCIGFDSMQSVKNKVTLGQLPYISKIKKVLGFTSLTHVSEEFTTMEELNQKSKLFQQEISRELAKISGSGVLLPQLHCGDTLLIDKQLDGKEKEGYVETVMHRMQAGLYTTAWQACLKKG